MTRSGFRFASLPRDAFTTVTDFLLGSDLLPFSHVDHTLLKELLEPDSAVWKQRLSVSDTVASLISAKQRYFTSRSFRFPGTIVNGRGEELRGGTISLPVDTNQRLVDSSFTIALTFALQPSPADPPHVYTGGILLGAQSGEWGSFLWEADYEQLIHVDPLGNLYCTVTDTKQIVAEHLEMQRWYHLALVYDKSDAQEEAQGIQRVYLDGKLIHCSKGALLRNWPKLAHTQLGSAWLNRGAMGEPTEDFNCWYGFCGVIDACGIWSRALVLEEIQGRKRDGEAKSSESVVWSLQQAEASRFRNVRRVQCSRPAEGHCHGTTAGVAVASTP